MGFFVLKDRTSGGTMKKTLFLALLSIGLIRVAAASNGNAFAYGHEKNGNAYAHGREKGGSDSGATVPEINSGAAAMALALLLGGALVLRGRRKPELE